MGAEIDPFNLPSAGIPRGDVFGVPEPFTEIVRFREDATYVSSIEYTRHAPNARSKVPYHALDSKSEKRRPQNSRSCAPTGPGHVRLDRRRSHPEFTILVR
jgi:hypothetical protein